MTNGGSVPSPEDPKEQSPGIGPPHVAQDGDQPDLAEKTGRGSKKKRHSSAVVNGIITAISSVLVAAITTFGTIKTTGGLLKENQQKAAATEEQLKGIEAKANATKDQLKSTTQQVDAIAVPVGGVIPYAGNIDQTIKDALKDQGWLVCDGHLVSRKEFPDLFKKVQYTFGKDDTDDNFKVPDLQGRFVLGVGSGRDLTARTLAATGGQEKHTLSAEELPPHAHGGTTDLQLPMVGVLVDRGGKVSVSSLNAEGAVNKHSHKFVTDNGPGNSKPFETLPPYVALNYLIKAR